MYIKITQLLISGNIKTCANGSIIVKHAWSFNYRIDFDNSSVTDKGSFCIIAKHWRLGTPLLPSMLTIILSQFQTSIVFFSNNSHCFTRLYFTFVLSIVLFHLFS